MKILELFHAIDIEEACEVYKKKNIRQYVMAEWDRLVEHCSNDLPVFVSEKLIDGSSELCFCCIDSPSMDVIHLPCCKASVHTHCVLEALQSNNQCVYCRQFLILKILLIVLLNARYFQERQTFPKPQHFHK